jgi:transposase-like protein
MQSFNPIEDLFQGRHFDRQIIILCVSSYASFKLSLRDLVIMMADRGICVTHTTILRWAQRYLPEFEERWRRYARRFDNAVVTISGIELAEKIKKGQCKTGKLGGCKATMTELWNAALAA